MKKFLFPLAGLVLTASCANGPTIEEQVESVLSQMTLDEKIAIIHAQSKFSSPGVPRLGIPELWTDDGPNGVRPEVLWDEWKAAGWTNDACTAFPGLTCLAASWDRSLAEEFGINVGEEARYRKKNVLLGPGVNIMRTPLCGRNFEYMGEDPFLAGEMCVPYIKGVQSNDVAVCVKHFALNNHECNRLIANVTVDDRALYEIYLPAFKSAVQKGGAWSIMGAYNLSGNQQMCHNDRFLNGILKKEWDFDGAVISDWGGTHNTDEAIRNGLDLEFGTWTDGETRNHSNAYDSYFLAEPYKKKILSGEFGQDELNDKCRRVLRLMMRTKMGGEKGFGRFTCPEHYAAARKIGNGGIVLLKNVNGILPVSKEAKKIVVLGENAIKPMAVGGSSSSLKAEHEITPLEGIRNMFKNSEVVYERAYLGTTDQGSRYNYSQYDISDPRSPEQMLSDAAKAMEGADYVIFVGGQNKTKGMDCEGADRESYSLPYGQDSVLETLAGLRSDIIFVSIAGSPYSMPWKDKVGAIVQAWYMGSEAGNSLADVLSGDVNPSGKLPFTWGEALADYPIRTEEQYPGLKRADENIWDVNYTESIYVGYRWFEKESIKPLFAFGYGLSYTTFEYGQATVSKKKTRDGRISVSVPVTNTGDRAGAEVVQLYISDTQASVDRPVKELKGFDKVWLEPGETKTVRIAIDESSLSFFDAPSHKWIAEPGEFTALVGSASDDIRTTVTFTLNK